MTDSHRIPPSRCRTVPSASPSVWEHLPVPVHPSLSQCLRPHHLGAAWPRCAGKRDRAALPAVEHSGQMLKVHFATASPAEAAELEACTYLATTWHGKKGHSSLRNSLRTWRHPLVIRREATERVFPIPRTNTPPPQARLAPGRAVGARQGAGGLWDAAFAIRSLTLGRSQHLGLLRGQEPSWPGFSRLSTLG